MNPGPDDVVAWVCLLVILCGVVGGLVHAYTQNNHLWEQLIDSTPEEKKGVIEERRKESTHTTTSTWSTVLIAFIVLFFVRAGCIA